MKLSIRYIVLWPLSILYGLITWFRNAFYNVGVCKSYKPTLPTIVVGNLAVGGTGKTPHIEMLLRFFEGKYNTAVLSRGYKRKTKGFVLANSLSTSSTIGDEPFQLYRKFKNTVIAVDESRVNGVSQLQKKNADIELVLLDDAFQHRAINPGYKILLTDFSNLYCNDSMLPGGNLREFSFGAHRADTIVVTKCPTDLSEFESDIIAKKLNLNKWQQLFFSSIVYDSIRPLFSVLDVNNGTVNLQNLAILLVTGIVSHQPLVDDLEKNGAIVQSMPFSDHHHFTKADYLEVKTNFISLSGKNKIILVTEKDAARIVSDANYPDDLKSKTYFIPITVQILHNKQLIFESQLLDYVETNK